MYRDGIIAGLLGAASVASWFLVLDVIGGKALLTPTILGMAVLLRRADADLLHTIPVSLDLVVMFTFVHVLVFVVIGVVTSLLLTVAGQHPGVVFGLLLLFVLESGFNAAAAVFAEPVLRMLSWPSVLVANLLAAAVMSGYFWLQRRAPSRR